MCNYLKVFKSIIIFNLYGGFLIKGLGYVFGLRLLKKKKYIILNFFFLKGLRWRIKVKYDNKFLKL